jgi:hypothetical protein
MTLTFHHDVADTEMANVLNIIGTYARDNNISPAQVKAFFNIGIVSLRLLSEADNQQKTPAVTLLEPTNS